MILILGGTTEGRKAVQVVESAGKPYYYSTVGNEQAIETVHAIRLTGGMDEEDMARFCREKEISLLVDAAHPFAIQLHRTLAKVSSRLRIPVVRLERQYPAHDKRLIWCTDYAAAIDRLRADGICNLLALTGVKTIAKLRPYWEQTPCWFRILNRKESLSLAESNRFPKERIIFFHEGEDEKKLLDRLHPDAILTKESGESGYFKEKVEAAQACGIPVYVIQRPPLPDSFTFVQGLEGLRKAIERLAPGFFPLRNGFTTGACATAAAKAALVALLSQTVQTTSCITLPSGEKITLPVTATEWVENAALCTVIKDSGDDPDVTNGCSVIARIELQAGQSPVPVILFRGGCGGLAKAGEDIVTHGGSIFLKVEAAGILPHEPGRDEIAQFIGIVDHIRVKADGKPAGFGFVVHHVHEYEQRAFVVLGIGGTQGIAHAGAGLEIKAHVRGGEQEILEADEGVLRVVGVGRPIFEEGCQFVGELCLRH